MQDDNLIDYGPLTGLIGTWSGNKGKDLAPEPDGTENNEYYEVIIFSAAHDISNAEEQNLASVHYTQKVQRISNDKIIHQETGYWTWEQGTNNVMHSLTIPRGLCVLSGGTCQVEAGVTSFSVEAAEDCKDWPISQSRFLQKKALTKTFKQTITLSENTLEYSQHMLLDIYGREFDHNDHNTLTRV